jgi:hypothetical protein
MREYDEYRRILELWEMGTTKKRIAINLGIPRATVRNCIYRYGSLKALENNRERASRSTPYEVLDRIQNPENLHIQQVYTYILGIYLGDGNITKVRNVYRIRITLDARYPNIIQKCSDAIQILLPENQIGIVKRYYRNHLSCVDVSCFHKFWPEILPQHGIGRKHNREIALADWQQMIVDTYPLEFFRGLYHSDGSRFSNVVNSKDYPRYQFTNMSDDIRRMFCETCDKLGLHWTLKQRRSQAREQATDVFISKRKNVEYLDRVVGRKVSLAHPQGVGAQINDWISRICVIE